MLRFFGRIKTKSSHYRFGIDLQNSKPYSVRLNNTASVLVFICSFRTGVLHTSVVLLTEMCERSPDMLAHFRKVCNILYASAFLVWKNIFPEKYMIFSQILFWKEAMELNTGLRQPCCGVVLEASFRHIRTGSSTQCFRFITEVFSHCWQAQQSLMCSICCFHIEVRTCNLRSDYKQELYVCVFLRQLISFSFFLRWKLQTVIWHYFYLKQGSLRFILSWWLRWWKSLAFFNSLPLSLLHSIQKWKFLFSPFIFRKQ